MYIKKLQGTWTLQEWKIQYQNPDRVSYPYSKTPNGVLMYSENGWMSASIHHPLRKKLPNYTPPKKLPAEVLAECYRHSFHYCGQYRVEGTQVKHEVMYSLYPNMIGTTQIRDVDFMSNDRLILTGHEILKAKPRLHVLQWERIHY